ncbi:Ig-like domain-containing protein [Maribacter arcticus]|uniref:Pectate lyase n=1 Tax=Maribacter arcticus TaxID=561365 RepID=A0A1T5BH88_9FLAO|nr:hypothetical protein [Maribacter arcticus]SKB46379.1 Pectate lyase [Maribacter arcticus]
MPITTNTLQKVTLTSFVLFSLFSCSKDADLLSEYVITKDDGLQSIALLANDSFYMAPGQGSILMDVLNNDNISDNANVTIIETSSPINGTVTINNDNTLTYKAWEDPTLINTNSIPEETTPEQTTPVESTPEETTPEQTTPVESTPEETTPVESTPIEDTFTYTAEVVDEETGTATIEEATVTVSSTNTDMGELLAFPGAAGYGKNTTGGRGGMVYRVTNLNDSGAGSLRYGIETLNVTRTIVFEVSGYIDLETPIKIRAGYGNITIAGQTAPNDGITIRGSSIWIHAENVIVRYLKIKPGKNAYNPAGLSSSDPNYEPDDGIKIVAYSGNSIENIIIDHCTVTWAHDGLIDVGSPNLDLSTYARNITIQNCLLGENIDKHYGVLIQRAYDLSFYRNIIAFTNSRNIAVQSAEGKGVEMVNNLIYGTPKAAWYIQGNVVDFIGNKFITGPYERQYQTFRMELGPLDYNIENSAIYLNGNVDDSKNADDSYNNTASPYIVNSPNHNTNLEIISQSELENSLIDYVGDNIHYDEADIRIMNSIKSRTGNIISNENSVGGYPTLKSDIRSENYDSDKDGMSDAWERSTFGNLSKKSDTDENGDGYTNLEAFLYSLEL